MINIDVNSSLSEVISETGALAQRIFTHNRAGRDIVKDRQVLLAWFLADLSRKPEDIVIPGLKLGYIPLKQHLTPARVLAYAEQNNLPLEELQQMIDTICIVTAQTLKFQQVDVT